MPFLLFAISVIVYVGLTRRKNMWGWIVVYWMVLSMKNLIDSMGVL